MHKYTFPAVFTEEENGQYSVEFPDIDGCATCGDDLNDAMEMAQDALSLMLCEYEDSKEKIPTPTKISDIKVTNGEFVSLIACDTVQYRKQLDKGEVTRVITIPAWLNVLVEKTDIDCSALLKKELMKEFGF